MSERSRAQVGRQGMRCWVVVAGLLVTAAPRALPAQASLPIVVVEQSLGFGLMMPGVTETVAVTDGWRRATLRMEGSGQHSVRFLLPASLQGLDGTMIPLQFGATAGAYRTRRSAALQQFDPQVGTKINLTAGQGAAWIYLGATAIPAPLQRAGSYQATITVVVAAPNT